MRGNVKNGHGNGRRLLAKPYVYAIALACVLTILVKPEVMEEDYMEPAIKRGGVVLASKTRYSQKRGIPKRGTVVVLEKTIAKKLSKDNIIGRVVGLPGEKIEIRNEKFYINGKETSLNKGQGSLGEDQTFKLNGEQVFILSDKRDRGKDSRNKELGPVNMRSISGKAILVIWPLGEIGGIK